MEAEFGFEGKVRFLSEDQVTAYDEDGEVVLCSKPGCKKKAGSSLIGRNVQHHFCTEHFHQLSETPAQEMIYRNPSKPIMVDDTWIMNAREHSE